MSADGDMIPDIPTPADAVIELQKSMRYADPVEMPGLHLAIDRLMPVPYSSTRGLGAAKVIIDRKSPCRETGVCTFTERYASSMDELLAGKVAEAEKDLRFTMANDCLNAMLQQKEMGVYSRLNLNHLEEFGDTEVVTTIVPMCGVCWSTDRLQLDHIVAKSAGGPDDWTNYQLLCKPCNMSKKAQDMDAWMTWVNTDSSEQAHEIRSRRARNRETARRQAEG